MKKEIIIPKELDNLLSSLKNNKTFKKSLIEVYNSLVYLKKTKPEFKLSKNGSSKYSYFDTPSAYLKRVNSRYKKYISVLIESRIINYYSKNQTMLERNLFEEDEVINHKYYNIKKKDCIKYRFLIDIDKGVTQIIEIKNPYENTGWYDIAKKSLEELGLEGIIKRDSFGRRLHTRITMNTGVRVELDFKDINLGSYKNYLVEMYKGKYSVVDARCCQPTLMYEHLKDKKIVDPNFNYPFENNLDFYQYLVNVGLTKDRNEGKSKYTSWQNGKYYDIDEKFKDFFKISSNYINKVKKERGYKKIGQIITRDESKIFIDNLLSDIKLDFCLTIHDSLLVRTEDLQTCLDYCNEKYSDVFKFKTDTF